MTTDTRFPSVRQAADTDQQTVLKVLTEAFLNDPLVRWLFPDADDRRRLQPSFYRPLLTHPGAEAYLAGHREGASIWLRLAAGPPIRQGPADMIEAAPDANGARLLALGQALAQRHPDHEPHVYLACMGVLGGRQGSGIGSAMLRDRLTRADTERLPAYLEASSPRSRDLYLRHGFKDLGEPVRAADSPQLWPMWRQPHR